MSRLKRIGKATYVITLLPISLVLNRALLHGFSKSRSINTSMYVSNFVSCFQLLSSVSVSNYGSP